MKKMLLITTFCVLNFFMNVKAQSTITYSFGVKSGMNLSHLIEKYSINKLLFSYVVGVTLEQQFSPRIALSYELLYSRQGDMRHFTNTTDLLRTRYNYITLPIEIRYRLKHYPIYVIPGFQAGYLVHKQLDLLPSNGNILQSSDQEKKVDLGISAGLGYRFNKRFFCEAKYYQSLRTILRPFFITNPVSGVLIPQTTPNIRNEVFSLSMSYYFLTK